MENQPEKQAAAGSASAGTRETVALSNGRGGILGVKAGMTQVYTADGDAVAVTVIDLKPAVITQVKGKEKNGYQAIQVGFLEKKEKSASKPEKGHFKASGTAGFYHVQEFRLAEGASMDGLTVGKVLSPEFVKEGDLVDLTAMSKSRASRAA